MHRKLSIEVSASAPPTIPPMDEGYPVDSQSTSTQGRFPLVNLGLTIPRPPTTTVGIDTRSVVQYTLVNEGGSASHAGAFFPQSKGFVITGGEFTSNTHIHNPTPPPPSDFPMIPLGHLDLCHEIRLDSGSNTVHRGHSHDLRSVRKIYSARVTGVHSKMTVAVYQGQAAKEEWQQEISQYAQLRHPNLIQLFGTVSTAGLHAAVYHDELIPVKRIREERLRASHLSLAYFLTSMKPEFEDVRYYVEDVDGSELWSYYCTLWIRPSNGRLCVDLTLMDDLVVNLPVDGPEISHSGTFLSGISLLESPEDSQMIASLSLDEYHVICSSDLVKDGTFSIPTHASVTPAAIYRRTSGTNLDNLSEIAYIPEWQLTESPWNELLPGWWTRPNKRTKRYPIMENGWTRVDSSEAEDIKCIIHTQDMDLYWFAQADHIFNRLGITSNYEDYVMVSCVRYWVKISEPRDTTPPSYLFLCPLGNLQPDIPSRCWASDWPAYWSLDPTGVQRLSADEASARGLPAIEVGKEVDGIWWDSSVYDGLRQFHESKGFDPDTQDVAQYLGYPLFKLSSENDVPVAHIEEDNDLDENEDRLEVIQTWADDTFVPSTYLPSSSDMATPYDSDLDTTQFNLSIFNNPPPLDLGLDLCLYPFDFGFDYSAFAGQEFLEDAPALTGGPFDRDSFGIQRSIANYAPAFMQAPFSASDFPTNNISYPLDWNALAPQAELLTLPIPPASSPLFVPEIPGQKDVPGELTGGPFDRDSVGMDQSITNYAPAFLDWNTLTHTAELWTLSPPRASSPLSVPLEQTDVSEASYGSNFDVGNILHTDRARIGSKRSFDDAIAANEINAPVSKK